MRSLPSFKALQARFVLPLPRGQSAFVKVALASKESTGAFERESLCLERLQGLAIPRLVKIPKRRVADIVGTSDIVFMAQEFLPGRPFVRMGLSHDAVLGTWLFIVEHLVAFRRVGIVYTDVKVTNVVLRDAHPNVTILDFGHAQAVASRGRYPNHAIAFTPGFEAPEQTSSRYTTERSLVYELGAMLMYATTGMSNMHWRDTSWGKTRLERRITIGLAHHS